MVLPTVSKILNDNNNNLTLKNFFESKENQFLCLNPLINSHPIHKLKQIIAPSLTERILVTTDSPHNAFSQKNFTKAAFNQPINIVRTIIQMHYQLSHIHEFKNHHLYETNEWFFNKAFNLFPTFSSQSVTQYKIIAKETTKGLFETWSKKLKYDRITPKLNNRFVTSAPHEQPINTKTGILHQLKPHTPK